MYHFIIISKSKKTIVEVPNNKKYPPHDLWTNYNSMRDKQNILISNRSSFTCIKLLQQLSHIPSHMSSRNYLGNMFSIIIKHPTKLFGTILHTWK